MAKKITLSAYEFLSIYETRTYTSLENVSKTLCKVFGLDEIYTLSIVTYSKAFKEVIDAKYPELRDCVASIKPFVQSKDPEENTNRLTDHVNAFVVALGTDKVEIESMADVQPDFGLNN